MKLETVRVVHPDLAGGVLINRSNFDPNVHALWGFGEEQEPRGPETVEVIPVSVIDNLSTIEGLRSYAEAHGLSIHPRATNVDKAREKLMEQIAAKE